MNEIVIGCSSIGVSTTIESIATKRHVVCVGWKVVVVTIIVGIPKVIALVYFQESLLFMCGVHGIQFFFQNANVHLFGPTEHANLMLRKKKCRVSHNMFLAILGLTRFQIMIKKFMPRRRICSLAMDSQATPESV